MATLMGWREPIVDYRRLVDYQKLDEFGVGEFVGGEEGVILKNGAID